MTTNAVELARSEKALAVPCRARELVVDQIRARHWLQSFNKFVERGRDLLPRCGEKYGAHSGSNAGSSIGANAQRHHWGRLKTKDQALYVLRVAHAIVKQIPIKPVHAPIGRVAAGTALPALIGKSCIIEVQLSFSYGHHLYGILQLDRRAVACAAGGIQNAERIGKVIANEDLLS